MNKIPELPQAAANWGMQAANSYQTRVTAQESVKSDLSSTQRAAQAQSVDVGGKREPAAAEESVFSEQSTEQLAKKLNESLKHQDLEFSVDKDTGSTVITVTSRNTGEVVRQIPSEEVLHLMRDVQQQVPDGIESARIFDQSA